MITFHVKQAALDRVKRYIDKKAAQIASIVSNRIYERIILTESNHPYWSGSYITSWNISEGSPDVTFNDPDPKAHGDTGRYLPEGYFGLPDIKTVQAGPYQKIYISNYTPHAYQIEYEGTKTHVTPWMTAHHAKNMVVAQFS